MGEVAGGPRGPSWLGGSGCSQATTLGVPIGGATPRTGAWAVAAQKLQTSCAFAGAWPVLPAAWLSMPLMLHMGVEALASGAACMTVDGTMA